MLLAECRADSDFGGVARLAQMIVSTASNLGAKQTGALACLLEVSCTKEDNALSDRLIDKLQASCELSSGALKRWLKADFGVHIVHLNA